AGDGEARRRERGREYGVGIAGAVEVVQVREDGLAREAGDLAQKLREGNGEAEVDERLGDLPAPDPERAVAGHAGDHALARVDDAQVVEPRHVDAVPDELGELLRRGRLAAGDRER